MITRDDDEVWYWYEHCEKFLKTKMGQTEYCKLNNVNYKSFSNLYYRIVYRRFSDPELYEKYVPLTREYISSGLGARQFSEIHNIDRNILGCMTTHLNYLDIIERLKQERNTESSQDISPVKPEPAKMNFIQVKTKKWNLRMYP